MITVSPAEDVVISPVETVTLEVTDLLDSEVWLTAQYGQTATVEVVHDGSVFVPKFADSAIELITNGVRYRIRRVSGWPTVGLTLRCYAMGGGGGSGTMGAPIVDKEPVDDATGIEKIVLQLPVETTLAGLSMVLKLAILAGSTAVGGTIRAYIGGTKGAIDGTLVGSVACDTTLGLLRITGSPVANPGTVTLVTVTVQSSTDGETISKYGITGVLG